jgi:hypothetical protein
MIGAFLVILIADGASGVGQAIAGVVTFDEPLASKARI